jgi:hypothetical protein
VVLADDLVDGGGAHPDGERRAVGSGGTGDGVVVLGRGEQVAHAWKAIRVLAALGRLITRSPLRFVAVWAVLIVAGLLAASGVVGEGLFGRLEPGDAA